MVLGEQTLPATPGPLTIQRTTASVQLSYPTEPGRPYRIEYTESLPLPQWQTLEDFTGDGSVHVVLDQVRPGQNRFYRLAGY